MEESKPEVGEPSAPNTNPPAAPPQSPNPEPKPEPAGTEQQPDVHIPITP